MESGCLNPGWQKNKDRLYKYGTWDLAGQNVLVSLQSDSEKETADFSPTRIGRVRFHVLRAVTVKSAEPSPCFHSLTSTEAN